MSRFIDSNLICGWCGSSGKQAVVVVLIERTNETERVSLCERCQTSDNRALGWRVVAWSLPDFSPIGPAPRVSPALRPLMGPCVHCHGEVRLAGVRTFGVPAGDWQPCADASGGEYEWVESRDGVWPVEVSARITVTTLCSDCGQVAERYGWTPVPLDDGWLPDA